MLKVHILSYSMNNCKVSSMDNNKLHYKTKKCLSAIQINCIAHKTIIGLLLCKSTPKSRVLTGMMDLCSYEGNLRKRKKIKMVGRIEQAYRRTFFVEANLRSKSTCTLFFKVPVDKDIDHVPCN